MVKLNQYDIIKIRDKASSNSYTHEELAKQYGVSRGHITKIINHKRWKIFYFNGKAEEQHNNKQN